MTSHTSRTLAFSLAMSLLAASTAGAQTCNPESYSNDPAAAAGLPVEDFQSFSPAWWGDYSADAPLVAGGAAMYGTLWISAGWSIPGMDGTLADGTTNLFVGSGVDMTIEPLAASDRIAFRYGTQYGPFMVKVTLSDGSTRTFSLTDQDAAVPTYLYYPGGAWGQFVYCTGDPTLTIARLYLSAADGGR